MSLFTSFNAGVAGLKVSQSGITTTSHNLSNADTDGYSRQQNINTDVYYNTLKVTSTGLQQIGYGSTVSAVRQIRDLFLDKEYRAEVSRKAFYQELSDTESEVEDIFGETEGVEFSNQITDLWDTIESLSTNPESVVNRQLFISQCQSFLEAAKNIYSSLETYQTSLNTEISSQVDSINSIGQQIAEYNVKIKKAEASGVENANDYRDARNELMDQLAEYTNFNYAEDSDGGIQIYINGAIFVDEGISYHMGCEKLTTQTYDNSTGTYSTDASTMYKVVWLDNGYGDVYDLDKAYSSESETDMGSLLGILTARGNKVADYTDIPVKPVESDYYNSSGVLDEAGKTAYKVALNKYYEELEKYNNTTGNSIITEIQAQFDTLINGMVTMINDIFSPNVSTNLTGVSAKDADGNVVTLSGTETKVLDINNCAVGADDDATMGTEIFSRKTESRYTTYTLTSQIYKTDENGNYVLDSSGNKIPMAEDNGDGTYSLYVYNEEDVAEDNTLYTLDSLVINSDLLSDYSLLPVKSNPSLGETGSYDYSIYTKLSNAWKTEFAVLNPNTLTTYDFSGYYTAMIGALGTEGELLNSTVDNQTSLIESTEGKRQQIAGVSTEEEMVNLLTYQHAYNAASRYITTIDSMLQYLIEKLG